MAYLHNLYAALNDDMIRFAKCRNKLKDRNEYSIPGLEAPSGVGLADTEATSWSHTMNNLFDDTLMCIRMWASEFRGTLPLDVAFRLVDVEDKDVAGLTQRHLSMIHGCLEAFLESVEHTLRSDLSIPHTSLFQYVFIGVATITRDEQSLTGSSEKMDDLVRSLDCLRSLSEITAHLNLSDAIVQSQPIERAVIQGSTHDNRLSNDTHCLSSSLRDDQEFPGPGMAATVSVMEPGREQFTVGWICALPIEAAAAWTMLDKTYQPVHRGNPQDTNSYMLGRIGGHNVVIASLPSGSNGITSTATMTVNMLSSFPNIRFGLLVGIGGGSSSKKHDIRLGDVVVSRPHGSFGTLYSSSPKDISADCFQEVLSNWILAKRLTLDSSKRDRSTGRLLFC